MVHVGTSGYNYPEWKGSFYPDNLAASKMLPYYSERFSTVEINYTFYRMPTARLVTGWAAQVPAEFKFTLKAPKRITHDRKLRDAADLVRGFCDAAAELGPQLGALLFQLAPSFRKDLGVFDEFLRVLPPRVCAAFEFRHDSWLDEEVYARLHTRNLALCIADSETRSTPVMATADYAYLRLRDEGYTEQHIGEWADRVRDLSMQCKDVYVYFKHEDEGKGPLFARQLLDALATKSTTMRSAQ
ncbi:MAG TPA: DUF72 domain-containing protein [Vicinamibacterales bacterium]|nr:DUF72 domain-containing protein [Vicinamibacterales bacterium]